MTTKEVHDRMCDAYSISHRDILFARKDQVVSTTCIGGRAPCLGVCELNGASVVVIISRINAIIAHLARVDGYWNPSRYTPEETWRNLDMKTGMESLIDHFLMHRHDWYGEDHGVYAVMVSAAADNSDEGENALQNATAMIKKQLEEWRIPVRETTYPAHSSNHPSGPTNAMVLADLRDSDVPRVWVNKEVIAAPNPPA